MLEQFQKTGDQLALVIDEYGGIEGIVTLTDMIQAIVGDLRVPGEDARPRVTRREDGSWLVDGSMPITDLLEYLDEEELPGEDDGFTTVAGYVLANLARIPAPGDYFAIEGWRFEVVDMDGNRIDKVLLSRVPAEPPEES